MPAKMASQHRYAFIDALRGYAVLGVISVHVSTRDLPSPLHELASSGRYGVQLFFVVSALTLMLSWRARDDGVTPFYIRRLLRIAPMFWLAIPFYLLVDGLGPRHWAPNGVSWPHILATAPFLHGWHPASINSVVPGGWSIAVEMTFYAVFPLLAVALRSWSRAVVALAVAILAARIFNPVAEDFFASAVVPDQPARLVGEFVDFWFINQFPVFLVGFLVFFALRDLTPPKFVVWSGLVASIALIIALPFVYLPGPPHLKYAFSFGMLAFCLGRGAGSLLVNGAICQLGKISYSAYLWHFAVVAGLKGALDWDSPWRTAIAADPATASLLFAAMMAAVICITAALSLFTYTFVEQPTIAAGARILRRRTPADACTVADARAVQMRERQVSAGVS